MVTGIGFYIKNIDDSRHLIGIDRGSEVEGSVLDATIGAPRTYGVNFGILLIYNPNVKARFHTGLFLSIITS